MFNLFILSHNQLDVILCFCQRATISTKSFFVHSLSDSVWLYYLYLPTVVLFYKVLHIFRSYSSSPQSIIVENCVYTKNRFLAILFKKKYIFIQSSSLSIFLYCNTLVVPICLYDKFSFCTYYNVASQIPFFNGKKIVC